MGHVRDGDFRGGRCLGGTNNRGANVLHSGDRQPYSPVVHATGRRDRSHCAKKK